MSYRLYHNLTSRFGPYTPGDKLWFDDTEYGETIPLFAGTVFPRDTRLAKIFETHNRDDRPDGQIAPSLSVGDIVALDWGSEACTTWAVERFGWKQIEPVDYLQVVNAANDALSYFAARDLVEVPR